MRSNSPMANCKRSANSRAASLDSGSSLTCSIKSSLVYSPNTLVLFVSGSHCGHVSSGRRAILFRCGERLLWAKPFAPSVTVPVCGITGVNAHIFHLAPSRTRSVLSQQGTNHKDQMGLVATCHPPGPPPCAECEVGTPARSPAHLPS